MTPRELFEAKGKLKQCPNKSRFFSFWKFYGAFQWGNESWCHLSDRGYLHTHFLDIGVTETTEGLVWFRLLLWRVNFVLLIKESNENI